MYSVVLAMALVGGADAPDCCHWGRNSCGCWGGGYGGCYGGGCYGGGYGGGCYGGGYGNYGGGCYGGGMYYGGGTGGVYYGNPVQPTERVGEPKKGKDGASLPSPGMIIVNLPANSKLTIDGQYVSQQTSTQRHLMTPPIEVGKQFTYSLVAETTRDGQPVTQTQQVTVQPGQRLEVNFTFPATPVAAGH